MCRARVRLIWLECNSYLPTSKWPVHKIHHLPLSGRQQHGICNRSSRCRWYEVMASHNKVLHAVTTHNSTPSRRAARSPWASAAGPAAEKRSTVHLKQCWFNSWYSRCWVRYVTCISLTRTMYSWNVLYIKNARHANVLGTMSIQDQQNYNTRIHPQLRPVLLLQVHICVKCTTNISKSDWYVCLSHTFWWLNVS